MHPILKAYIPVANMLTQTFGKSCEVVIHDLTQPESSVVYVANGAVTGRKEGQAFDHLIRKVLLNKNRPWRRRCRRTNEGSQEEEYEPRLNHARLRTHKQNAPVFWDFSPR